ncbi:hypothetical protein RJ639_040423 [Escallonia herrerae]|uniref:MADS-box domain-containing protein n=1 Tax=Escallonia herrerae TaxID=1293975 RepID=A0AA89BC61_9ASTE|nr:hypothetical protein RJ639_040423 [Escallonia herrerae]
MGRIKVVLKRLERRRSRQSTYCKRRNGLIKKAHELSKLCEADVALLMFSPSGKPVLYHGDNSCWADLDKVDNARQLLQMEVAIYNSLTQLRTYKVYLGKQHQRNTQNAYQFQDEMDVSFRSAIEEQHQSFSWVPIDHDRPMVILEELNLLPQRDSESSAGSPLGTYSTYSGYLGTTKGVDKVKDEQEDDILVELSRNNSLSLHLNEQESLLAHEEFPYLSYTLDLLCGTNFQSAALMNMQDSFLDSPIDMKPEVLESWYEPSDRTRASTSGNPATAKLDEYVYTQARYAFHLKLFSSIFKPWQSKRPLFAFASLPHATMDLEGERALLPHRSTM